MGLARQLLRLTMVRRARRRRIPTSGRVAGAQYEIYGYQFTKGSYRIVKTYSTPNNHKEIAISAKFRLN